MGGSRSSRTPPKRSSRVCPPTPCASPIPTTLSPSTRSRPCWPASSVSGRWSCGRGPNGSRTSTTSPTTRARAPKRASRRSSRVPSAGARFGSIKRATCSASAAASATPTRPRAWSPSSVRPSRAPCGAPWLLSRSAPTWRPASVTAWQTSAAATGPTASSARPRMPGAALGSCARRSSTSAPSTRGASTPMADGTETDVDPALEDLLEYLRRSRGFDFSGYKRGSLGRRIAKRMHLVGDDDFRAYQRRLEAEPEEFVELFNTILINVTAFQRDGDAWKFLSDEVIPKILEARAPDEPVRAWSAGCASGEEAYTLAIVLCDIMGEEAFRQRVKVYGTDADEEALAVARLARYPAAAVHGAFNSEQVERYFEADGDGLVFRKDLRRAVIFGRHDLVQDPPISRVDLLVCRNTLMYFNTETQQRILTNFHFALSDSGF